jgi:hypothetical protein
MRFSRAKPTGSFRVYYPSLRRVTAHTDTLREAQKDAEFWSKQTPEPLEIQERFPSGAWVTIETVAPRFPSTASKGSKRSHATKASDISPASAPVTRYQVINYDVVGNKRDGFEVNGAYYSNEYIEIPEGASRAEIIRILKAEGILKKAARTESIEIDGETGYSLYFKHRPTGRPEFELRPARGS